MEAVEEVDRINELMSDLLGFASLDRMRLETVEVSKLLSAVVQRVSAIAGHKQVEVVLFVDHRLPPFLADTSKLDRALDNLMSNAISFSPRGAVVSVTAQQERGALRLSVSDQGPGIPVEDRERVLEPFYTGRRGGTGLGLAIAKQVAELHGGTINVGGREGKGTRISLLMPLRGVGLGRAAEPEPRSESVA